MTAADLEAPTVSDGTASDDVPVLELAAPLVGFPDLRRFALARLVEDGTICDLRSLEDAGVSFVVVPTAPFFPDYAPEVGDDVVTALGITDASDVLLLALITLGASPDEATANLRAPLLVNHRTRRALQVILDDPDLPMKAPLAAHRDAASASAQD